MSGEQRVIGETKWFNDEKGYGFIVLEGQEKDIFVHRQQMVRSGIDSLTEGEKVSFVVNDGKKGKFATSLKKEQ